MRSAAHLWRDLDTENMSPLGLNIEFQPESWVSGQLLR